MASLPGSVNSVPETVDEIHRGARAVGHYYVSSCMGTACTEFPLLVLECGMLLAELVGTWTLGGHFRAPEARHPDLQAMR